MSSVISRPYAFPDGPTRRAESSTSIPPPEPRSSTVSPARKSASAVGFPQPSEARSASAGRPSVSLCAYRFEEIGSQQGIALEEHPQPLVSPLANRRAASPYFLCTTSLMPSFVMVCLLMFLHLILTLFDEYTQHTLAQSVPFHTSMIRRAACGNSPRHFKF